MSKIKVLNTVIFKGCEESLEKLSEVAVVKSIDANRNDVLEIIHDYDVYFSSLAFRFDKQIIDKAKKLKLVVSPSTGTDHIDKKYLLSKGIKLFDLSKEFKVINGFSATSELAFTLLLNINRKIFQAVNSVKNNNWGREEYTGNQLLNKTFGVIGMGRLGTISSRIAKGFGMNVIYNDIKKIDTDLGKQVSLDFLCKNSDYISLHVHLTDETKNLINSQHFNIMKKSCIVINTSRGALINESDLLFALENKMISGAGLDMIDGEWMSNKMEHKLMQYSLNNENLIITPHIGGATYESIYGARIFMASKLYDYIKSL